MDQTRQGVNQNSYVHLPPMTPSPFLGALQVQRGGRGGDRQVLVAEVPPANPSSTLGGGIIWNFYQEFRNILAEVIIDYFQAKKSSFPLGTR